MFYQIKALSFERSFFMQLSDECVTLYTIQQRSFCLEDQFVILVSF